MKSLRHLTLLFSLALLITTLALISARHQPAVTSWTIITSRREDNDHELYRVLPNGSGIKRLTYRPAREHIVMWSPDGQWFYFTSQLDYGVFRMNILGNDMEMFGSGYVQFYTLTPDKEWFIVRMLDGIYRIRPDGSEFVLITPVPPSGILFGGWSPDKHWLYFSEIHNGQGTVWRVRIDGGPPQNVSPTGSNYYLAGMAPDGQHLVLRERGAYYLCLLDGSNCVPLDSLGESVDIVEAESHDHEWILVRRISLNPDEPQPIDGNPPLTQENLYRMRPDGSDPQALTAFTGHHISQITWHNDNWIYFHAGLPQMPRNIFRVRSDGSNLQQLTQRTGVIQQWLYDEQRIIFSGPTIRTTIGTTGWTSFYQMRLDGTDVQPLPGDIIDYPTYQSPTPIDRNWQPARLILFSLLAITIPHLARRRRLSP